MQKFPEMEASLTLMTDLKGNDSNKSITDKHKKNKLCCYKCKNKSNYYNRDEFVCKECFIKIIDHKFRSNLRANCRIRHEDFALVCISGGINSMAMLMWFNKTFNDLSSNRKLFFKLQVLYVDDSLFLAKNSNEKVIEERERRKQLLSNICERYQFNLVIINLEHIMSIPAISSEEIFNLNCENFSTSDFGLVEKYLELYQLIPSDGSFNMEYNSIMIRNLIFVYAIKNNFTKIFLGNSGQSLASDLFGKIIKGRGFNIRENIGYVDSHYLSGKVTILKPLKDFWLREILLFNHIYNLDIIHPTQGNKDKGKVHKSPFEGSTDRLISLFFEGIQAKKSNSITSVLGTAEKLKIKVNEGVEPICSFCLNPIDEVYNLMEVGSIDQVTLAQESIFSSKWLCFGCKRMFEKIPLNVITKLLPTFYQNK